MEIEIATRDIGLNFLFPSYVSDKNKKKEPNVYSVVRRPKITYGKVSQSRLL
jgi:hypothetical protein